MNTGAWSYDLIADFYATDMGQSMPFDDVAFYRSFCAGRTGRVLELGCGTGRILLALIAAGVDAIGVDRSLPMLQRLRHDAAELALATPAVAQMDIDAIALDGDFAVVLAPYSLITYVTDLGAARRLLSELRALLTRDGVLILDAFIPQVVVAYADFRTDYRRPHANGVLERSKRIEVFGNGTNRIQRRYRWFGPDQALVDEIVTSETIRPYPPDLIANLATDAGFTSAQWSFDYGATATSTDAQFASVVLR